MSKFNMILLSVILLLLIFLAGGLFYLISSNKDANNPEKAKHAEVKPKYDEKKYKTFEVVKEPIVSNLNSVGGDKRVIRVKPQLYVADDKIEKILEERKAEINDIIILILRSKQPDEMVKPEAQANLKKEITDRLNAAFKTDKILDVFFEEFIVQ